MENFGFDLDGVLHNFVVPAYKHAVRNYGAKEDFYTFWRDADKVFSKEQWDAFLSVPELYQSRALIEDVKTVWALSLRYNIFYVTSRPHNLVETTVNWLKRNGFPLLDDASNFYLLYGNKRPVIEKLNLKYYIEDRLHNAEQIKDLTTVIIKRTPWNRDARGYIEISRIPELLDIVL